MLISFVFVDLAAKLAAVYAKYPFDCTVEVAMIAFAFQFVQYEVDINDPKMIRAFIDFFRETLATYAPRYKDEDGVFINLNLGEIHGRLDEQNLASSVHVTAFGTKPCLKKGGPKCANHIDRENDTIWYHLRTTVADAFKSITNRNITEQSIETLVNDIAVVDTHTRCGTKGKGNSFPGFRDEVDEDPEQSALCSKYERMLELDEKISIGKKKYAYCKPIVIDMLLGLFNLVLYALYYYAVTKTALCVFISTVRSLIFFETVGGNEFNALVGEMIIVGKGLHPNAAQANLTNAGRNRRPFEDVVKMDEGMAYSLRHFHGRTINYVDDNDEVKSGQIEWGSSDAFQRTYNYRLTKKNRKELERREKELRSMINKLMAEQKRLLSSKNKVLKKQERLLSLNNKVLKTQTKQQATLDMYEKNRADAAARRKEDEARRDKGMAEVAKKRAKLKGSAFAALSN